MTIPAQNPGSTAAHSFTSELPCAHGGPAGLATLRQQPEDFIVDEQITVPAHDGGAHWWLQLEKNRLNSKDVATTLCRLSTARIRQIGFAGMKDKHAITRQWFSMPIETVDPALLGPQLPPEIKLLGFTRARKSIRRGGLQGNRFELRLRQFTGDRELLETRIAAVTRGVPNYFGDQRFGFGGGNLRNGRQLLAHELSKAAGDLALPAPRFPRHERGLYLSAVRSHLFNSVLAERVRSKNWDRLLPGEAINLAGSRSWFNAGESDHAAPGDPLEKRLKAFDIHPSGPLPGSGEPATFGVCAELEAQVLSREADLLAGLIALNMKAERRALRLIPENLQHQWQGEDLLLAFSLPKGCFATVVLRELLRPRALRR